MLCYGGPGRLQGCKARNPPGPAPVAWPSTEQPASRSGRSPGWTPGASQVPAQLLPVPLPSPHRQSAHARLQGRPSEMLPGLPFLRGPPGCLTTSEPTVCFLVLLPRSPTSAAATHVQPRCLTRASTDKAHPRERTSSLRDPQLRTPQDRQHPCNRLCPSCVSSGQAPDPPVCSPPVPSTICSRHRMKLCSEPQASSLDQMTLIEGLGYTPCFGTPCQGHTLTPKSPASPTQPLHHVTPGAVLQGPGSCPD